MREKMLVHYVFWLSLIPFCMTACVSRFQPIQVTGLQASVSQPGSSEVDIEVIFANAQHEITQILPKAYLNSFTFTGECIDLPQLAGTMHFGFIQVKSSALRHRVVSGMVSVNTINRTMDLRTADQSDHYPSTERLALTYGLPVREIAAIAYENILALGFSDCDVSLTRLDDSWYVVCTRLGSGSLGKRMCEFTVDILTGQVTVDRS